MVLTPTELKKISPLSPELKENISKYRQEISDILSGKDDRIILICGPCSIHNSQEAVDYARKLKIISDKHKETIFILMRTYFEKPRTTIGWKGLLHDPNLNQSDLLEEGLHITRDLLLKINEIGIPCATEFLDLLVPEYYSDLITWGCIGARTSESQPHRQMVSGLSDIPIGFKNGTIGSVKIAIDAILCAQHAHSYLSIDQEGMVQVKKTTGNKDCHVVLRGGWEGPTCKPNYYVEDLQNVSQLLQYAKLRANIMIDCSHGNSQKDYRNQPKVAGYLSKQIAKGNRNIIGLMLESNHNHGRQEISNKPLQYGISITDQCINLKTTEEIIDQLSLSVLHRRDI